MNDGFVAGSEVPLVVDWPHGFDFQIGIRLARSDDQPGRFS